MCLCKSYIVSINLQLRHAAEEKTVFRESSTWSLLLPIIFSAISEAYGFFVVQCDFLFSESSLCADRECVLFVFMHMNSIRWMPMIRWLKFPFRVHILHKTVQLSVHELRGGYVCRRVKACPTVPPSPWEQRGQRLLLFHFYHPWAGHCKVTIHICIRSKFCPIFISYTW